MKNQHQKTFRSCVFTFIVVFIEKLVKTLKWEVTANLEGTVHTQVQSTHLKVEFSHWNRPREWLRHPRKPLDRPLTQQNGPTRILANVGPKNVQKSQKCPKSSFLKFKISKNVTNKKVPHWSWGKHTKKSAS